MCVREVGKTRCSQVIILGGFATPAAKAALASVGLKQDAIKVVELDLRNDGEAIQDALLELTGGRSVPRVFIDGQFIGGGDDTDVSVATCCCAGMMCASIRVLIGL